MGWNPLKNRREREFARLDLFRAARKLAEEDVTVFGEQLTRLHEEMLTTELDEAMTKDYQRALDLYESSKSALGVATTSEEVVAVDTMLNDGRFHLACVLARRDGEQLPTRREPCFFNPQHGPGVTDVMWAPQNGVERQVPICRRDANRLERGEEPAIRLVRIGDRYVPWHEAGGSVARIGQHRAHVARGSDTRLTDKHIAEAHVRAATSNSHIWGNP